MSINQNLLTAVLTASLCFVLFNGVHSAGAGVGGPYQLTHHSSTTANAGVFRLDASTGEVSYCYLPTNQAEVTCTHGVK